jgi:hypothetical protein
VVAQLLLYHFFLPGSFFEMKNGKFEKNKNLVNAKVKSDVIQIHTALSGCTIDRYTIQIRCFPSIANYEHLKSLYKDLFAGTDHLHFPSLSKTRVPAPSSA